MLFPLLLASLGSSAAPAPPISPNYLLAMAPDSALSVLAVGGIDGIRESARKNAFVRFGRDSEVSALVDHFLAEAIRELSWDLNLGDVVGGDFDLEAFVGSLHGSLVVFSDMPDGNPERTVAGLMMDLGADRGAFDELFARLVDRHGSDAKVSGADYLGIPLTMILPANKKHEGALLLAELGDSIVLTGSSGLPSCRAVVEDMVERWAGQRDDGLLGCERFRAARASLGFEADIEGYLAPGALWEAMRRSGELNGADIPEPVMKEIAAIEWMNLGLRIGTGEELDFQVGIDMPEEGLIASFRGLIGGLPSDLLRHVPRQSTSLTAASLDLHGLYRMVKDMVRSFEPSEFEELEAFLEQLREQGIDLEGDFLGQFTGGFASFTVEAPPGESLLGMAGNMVGTVNGEDPTPSYASAALIGLNDTERVRTSVDRLIEEFGGDLVQHHEVDGFEFRSVGEPGFAALYFAFTPHSLVLSMQPTPVLEALRMLEDDAVSILDKGRFAKHVEAHRRSSHFWVCDTAPNLRSLLAGLRKVSAMLPIISTLSGWKVPRDFPIGPDTPWPSPSVVSRYFEGTIHTSMTWNEGSLRFALSSE